MKRRKVLIVGPRGSGKTTLAKSMMNGLSAVSKKVIRASGFTKGVVKRGLLRGVHCLHVSEFGDMKQLSWLSKRFALVRTAVIFEYQGYLRDIPIATQELFDEVIELKDSPF